MKRCILIFCILPFAFCLCTAQTTYNLDVIWHCPKPDTFPWIMWGCSIASGDFNNDGYIEIISYDLNGNGPGRTKYKRYMYSSNPLDTIPELIQEDSTGNDPSLCAGDWNGDGITDFVTVAFPIEDYIGRILICYGGVGFNLTATDTIYAPSTGIGYGENNAIRSGDVNGDGLDDLIIGAYWGGGVFIYYGDTLGLHKTHDIRLQSNYSENFGLSVASGDMNGDGYDEIAVGAPYNPEGVGGGKVYIFKGGNPMDTIPYDGTLGENIGAWLGEFNFDIVNNPNGAYSTGFWGTPFSPDSPPTPGKQYWVYGGPSFDGISDMSLFGYYYDSGIGYCSANAGDIDSNGYGDYISGAAYEGNERGAAYIWLGKAQLNNYCYGSIIGLDTAQTGGYTFNMGGSVFSTGDINRDGKDEFAISNYFGGWDSKLPAIWVCKYTGPVGVTGEPVNNEQLTLQDMLQNSPNPFSQSTIIKYQLSQSGQVGLKIYNIQGQMVKTLVNEAKKAGSYEIRWDGRDDKGNKATNGIYLYSLQTKEERVVKRMILLK
ncbi:MAG: FG-GAP-like repeat-containing protein [bacterium]|nr:FG-GAP-like repeat-containing protein [bacterium]